MAKKISEYCCSTTPLCDDQIICSEKQYGRPMSIDEVVAFFLKEQIDTMTDEELGKYIKDNYKF
jgi:hypothetical protein